MLNTIRFFLTSKIAQNQKYTEGWFLDFEMDLMDNF
jgi:hypothetical protein